MLTTTKNGRERILVAGQGGSGKTKAILDLARKNTDNKFWFMNNDGRVATLLERGYEDVLKVGNVDLVYVDMNDWKGQFERIKQISGEMAKDDWCVIDLIGPTWQAARHWFIEKYYGMEPEDYFLQVKKQREAAGKKGGSLEFGSVDYEIVTPEYNKIWRVLIGMVGHTYATSEVSEITEGRVNPEVVKNFGAYGVYPKGHKFLYHNFHDIQLFKKTRAGEYTMTSMKVTGRDEFEDEKVGDWTTSYLRKYAGWVEA